MTDTLTPSERSERMSRVRGKDTKPEMRLRRMVHAMGFRYRLHAKYLPGKPDLVFPSRRAVVFMHGCFWHRHEGCKLARMPKSRVSFWREKLEANRQRDRRNQLRLQEMGWRVLIVWECQLSTPEDTARRVRDFLNEAEVDHDEIG
ncbi:very short patch repair endonuclease [Salinicola acroporae]|uniref:Very short patch repair endonuclease n=1 Tax=Salinicola acroporae TaxID=1541440 RepID=A0ABT6I1A2_9GAMM|nr:very short patch repair endonuclease [Salinicola acroporae]MDH4571115.1 very short patch repair endonuclease [Salinicola acroporae]